MLGDYLYLGRTYVNAVLAVSKASKCEYMLTYVSANYAEYTVPFINGQC